MKINKRLMNYAIISLAISMVFTLLAYKTIKKSVEPEPKENIAYFKYNLNKGTKIRKDDLYMKPTPISLIPSNALKNISQVVNKTLVIDATAGDFALESNFISRGETKINVDDMFQIGIKVNSIDNFLGTQLKEGEYYGLLYIDNAGNSGKIYKIKLVNMIDGAGKIVLESGESSVEEINIAVKTHEEIREIAEKKRLGSFELVKIPENKWDIINSEEELNINLSVENKNSN